jgi:uncharacterized protein (TIGR00369 family)
MASNKPSKLSDWLQAEAAQRGRTRAAQGRSIAPEQWQSMDGLSQLQAMLRGERPFASIGQTMDFMLIEVEHGRAVFQGTPGPAHLNPMGAVHGGWYATLLDSALGCSVHAALPPGKGYTTLELKVNIVRAVKAQPAAPSDDALQRVRAEGQVIHLGRQTATADARLVGPDGRLYAHASTTCLVFDLPAGG